MERRSLLNAAGRPSLRPSSRRSSPYASEAAHISFAPEEPEEGNMKRFLLTIPLVLAAVTIASAQALADTPVVNDTTTQYAIGIQYASRPCWGTCDLSPSYNHYLVSS